MRHGIRQMMKQNYAHSTGIHLRKNRIKFLHVADDKSWKSIFRDIIIAFIPFFVLYKISTHPMLAKLGHQDPHAPKKRSQREMIEQSLYSLSLKRQQDELHKEHVFFEAMDENACYDAPTIDISAQLQPQKRRQPLKRRKSTLKNSIPHRQVKIGKQSLGKLLSKLYVGKGSRRSATSFGKAASGGRKTTSS